MAKIIMLTIELTLVTLIIDNLLYQMLAMQMDAILLTISHFWADKYCLPWEPACSNSQEIRRLGQLHGYQLNRLDPQFNLT